MWPSFNHVANPPPQPQPQPQHPMFGNLYLQSQGDQFPPFGTHYPAPANVGWLSGYPHGLSAYQHPQVDDQINQDEHEDSLSLCRYPSAEYLVSHHLNVPDIVQAWTEQNVDRIVKAYRQKGGWEGWAQVELASLLSDRFEATLQQLNNSSGAAQPYHTYINVQREVAVYRTKTGAAANKLADIVIEWYGPTAAGGEPGRYFIIIELKCESSHNMSKFVRAVEKDDEKMVGGFQEKYLPAMSWAFSFSVGAEGYRERAALELGSILLERAPIFDNGRGEKVALWMIENELAFSGS